MHRYFCFKKIVVFCDIRSFPEKIRTGCNIVMKENKLNNLYKYHENRNIPNHMTNTKTDYLKSQYNKYMKKSNTPQSRKALLMRLRR